jgi:hypothetical protein
MPSTPDHGAELSPEPRHAPGQPHRGALEPRHAPETVVQVVAGLAILASLAYLGWRLTNVMSGAVWLGVPLFAEEILRATLTGCAAIDYPNCRVWVLDGRRDWVRTLAERYGAEYLDRPDNAHAKAGNITAAIPRTSGELILSLDGRCPRRSTAACSRLAPRRWSRCSTPATSASPPTHPPSFRSPA